MKTPSGSECSYYFLDQHRERERETCQLLGNQAKVNWDSSLCRTCPVPGIERNNTCQQMVLKGYIRNNWLGLSRSMAVEAWCRKTAKRVAEPRIGCGHCHDLSHIQEVEE